MAKTAFKKKKALSTTKLD